MSELDDQLQAATEATYELVLRFLQGKRPSEEEFEQIWVHAGHILSVLAALQADTPKQVAVQLLEYAPPDDEWRETIFPRWVKAAQERDFH